MATQRRMRLAPAVVALAVGLGLAGCSAQPGTAAVINGSTITENELDDATLEYIDLTGMDTEPSVVLNTLMAAQVFPEIAAEHGIAYTDEQIAELFEEQAFLQGAEVPEGGYSEAFIDLGHYLFGYNQVQASPEGQAVLEEFTTTMAEADIEVNPRYGKAEAGVISPIEHGWLATSPAPQG